MSTTLNSNKDKKVQSSPKKKRKQATRKNTSLAMKTAKMYGRRKDVEARFLNAKKEFTEKYYDPETDEWLKIPNFYAICQLAHCNYNSFIAGRGAYDKIYPYIKNWVADIVTQTGDSMAKSGKQTSWWQFRLQKYEPRVQEDTKNIKLQVDVKMLPVLQREIEELSKNTAKTDTSKSLTDGVGNAILMQQTTPATNPPEYKAEPEANTDSIDNSKVEGDTTPDDQAQELPETEGTLGGDVDITGEDDWCELQEMEEEPSLDRYIKNAKFKKTQQTVANLAGQVQDTESKTETRSQL